jgi:copper transport protein
MTPGGRLPAVLAVLGLLGLAALVAPGRAEAHAALLHTSPSASGTVNHPPASVQLTYSESVEPRFAIVSVTDAGGHQVTSGPPRRSATNPHQLVTPLHRTSEGWYLVFWRVISADGHPVRGVFTFAVGPNPGPAPQFVLPSLSETAATPSLIATRWGSYLAVMAAIGLLVFRLLIARPFAVGRPGGLGAITVAFGVAVVAGLVLVPVYLILATAQFALRPTTDLGGILPLVSASSFGRSLLDFELVLGLFALAGAAAIWLDRPGQAVRSLAALLALAGALGTAAAVLVVPGLAGHAAQTSPAGLALSLDWLHLAAGSVWLGGLVGVLVLWWTVGAGLRLEALGRVVPRFSKVALGSVLLLVASGTWATILHLPTLQSLWQTSYGQALLVKIGLLTLTLLIAGVNLTMTTPRLRGAYAHGDTGPGSQATGLLRRTVLGEAGLVAAILVAAAVLTSLPPPSSALAKASNAAAHVGPGPVSRTVERNGYTLHVRVDPNRAALPNTFALDLSRHGRPVSHAQVLARFDMLDMQMTEVAYTLKEQAPGHYARNAPALVMVGHWAVTFEITPPGKTPFSVIVVDTAGG